MVLTDEDKKLIDKLRDDGKPISEIMKITGFPYMNIYNRKTKRKRKTNNVRNFVDNGREMPPVHKSELKIIADKNLVELACRQMGLKPPVCALAQRPPSYNNNGWVRVGNKWVAGQPVNNTGMLVRQPIFRRINNV